MNCLAYSREQTPCCHITFKSLDLEVKAPCVYYAAVRRQCLGETFTGYTEMQLKEQDVTCSESKFTQWHIAPKEETQCLLHSVLRGYYFFCKNPSPSCKSQGWWVPDGDKRRGEVGNWVKAKAQEEDSRRKIGPCCGEATGWAWPRENTTVPVGEERAKGGGCVEAKTATDPQQAQFRKVCRKDACWTREQLEPETSQRARSQRGEGKRSPWGQSKVRLNSSLEHTPRKRKHASHRSWRKNPQETTENKSQ